MAKDMSKCFKDGVARDMTPDTPLDELTDEGLSYFRYLKRLSDNAIRILNTPEEVAEAAAHRAYTEARIRAAGARVDELIAAGIPKTDPRWYEPVPVPPEEMEKLRAAGHSITLP